MKEKVLQDEITENEVLASLENAISSYKTKSFETIAKKSLKNSKSVKRAKKVVEEVEPEIIKTSVRTKKTNTKSAKLKTKTNLKKTRLGKGFIRRNINRIKNLFSNIKYFFEKYNRQILTTGLAIFLVTFVSYSTYIAYAFMSGANGDVVSKVGNHIVLPVGETPKVYIIQSEKSEIFQNPLFAGIAVGDNVLTYTNAGKVIIYRSKEDKIVNIVNTK